LFWEVLLPSCGALGDRQIAMVPGAFYVLFLLFALWKLREEVRMMAAVLPLRVLVAGLPDFLPGNHGLERRYGPYFLWKVFHSFLASFDIFSASLFLARIKGTRVLAQFDEQHPFWNVETVWHFSLAESPAMQTLVHHGLIPTFLQLATATWLVFFLQVLYSLAYSVPTSGEVQESARPPQAVAYDFRAGKTKQFHQKPDVIEKAPGALANTFSDDDPDHYSGWPETFPSVDDPVADPPLDPEARALQMPQLAETSPAANPDHHHHHHAGGSKLLGFMQMMAGIVHPQPKTQLVRTGRHSVSAVTDYSTYTTLFCGEQTHGRALAAIAPTGRLTLAASMDAEYLKLAIDNWKPHEILQQQRQQNQAFMVFMLQKLLNTSMQASLVGISANLTINNGSNAGADQLTLVTVLLSCVLGVGSVMSAVKSQMAMCGKVLDGVHGKLHSAGITKWQTHHEFEVGRTARWERGVSLLFSAWSLLFLFWCATKTLMAGICPCGMWNFKTGVFFPSNWGSWEGGCVFFANSTSEYACSYTNGFVNSSDGYIPTPLSFTNVSDSFLCSFLL